MPFFYKSSLKSCNNSYFAAANTCRGFVSFFDDCFNSYKRIIIKGGPGTGKSTRIKKLAEYSQEIGHTPIMFYCSSDTNSLDGVAIPSLGIALLDGTSPHALEARAIGAKDEIFNLCTYWNTNVLKNREKEIERISREISLRYNIVYSLLASAEKAKKAYTDICLKYINNSKLDNFISKFIKDGNVGEKELMQCDAFGVHGPIHLDTSEKSAESLYVFNDKYNISSIILKRIYFELEKQDIGFKYSLCPVDLSIYSVNFNGKCLTSFESPLPHKNIGTERFLLSDIKSEKPHLKSLSRLACSACMQAELHLMDIGSLHNALEEIYISAMDFEAMSLADEILKKKLDELIC